MRKKLNAYGKLIFCIFIGNLMSEHLCIIPHTKFEQFEVCYSVTFAQDNMFTVTHIVFGQIQWRVTHWLKIPQELKLISLFFISFD